MFLKLTLKTVPSKHTLFSSQRPDLGQPEPQGAVVDRSGAVVGSHKKCKMKCKKKKKG